MNNKHCNMMIESYKKLMQENKIDHGEAKKEIRIYELLQSCDKDDLHRLIDTGAFNDIIKAYCQIAIEQGNTRNLFDIDVQKALNQYKQY